MNHKVSLFLIVLFFSTGFSQKSILPTSLKITILDSDNNPVENVRVKLFGNEKDYRAGKDQIQETKETNARGQVVFKKLKPRKYYIYASKGELSNIGENVLTNELKEGRINKVTTTIN